MRTIAQGLILISCVTGPFAAAQQATGPERYEKDIVRFEKQIADGTSPVGTTLFIGSSSIRLWDVSKSFPALSIVNQGFGGSEISDSLHFFDRIVVPLKPRFVVMYAGDNDISKGKTPEQVHQDFATFAGRVLKDLGPETKLAYIAIKPSIKRWALAETIIKANDLIAADCAKNERLIFVDVWKPMLGSDGQPRPELFAKDGLHLNESGYELWNSILLPFLPKPEPAALNGFVPNDSNPVFTSQSGQWNDSIRERGWIIRKDGTYHMWFTGYNATQTPLTMKLGYATSPDGITWTPHPQNPIYDEVWVEDMMIVEHDNTFFMFAEGQNDQAQLLKSSDGLHWERVGTLDVRLTSGEKIPPGPYGTPTAYFENGTWYLFYERSDQGVWLATSKDMKVWSNVSDKPLIVPGPENYDRLMIAMNQVIKHEGRYYAVMHGSGTPTKPRNWCTYLAVSDDLRNWSKCDAGPLRPVVENKSSGQLVFDGKRFRLYTMHAKVELHTGM